MSKFRFVILILIFLLRKNFRWCLAAVMTRQNNVPLPEKDLKNVLEGNPVVFPTLVPGKKHL
jgi:hypothetical protein